MILGEEMNTRFVLAFAFCFVIAAAAAEAAVLAGDVTTFTIKPDQNFTVGDTAYLSLHVVSTNGPINFTANITLTGGSSSLNSFNVVGTTGTCTLFTCNYTAAWPFTVNSIPVSYQAVITDTTNNISITKTATTARDDDIDGYYSVLTGGNDCNDANAGINPGAAEVCGDGIDNDCSGGDAACPSSGGSDGGSSGGGGGSAGGSGSLISATYNCINEKVKVAPNDKINVRYGGANYTFFVKDILSNTITMKLYPIPSRDIQVKEGASKYIDLDWDNKDDLKMDVEDVESNVASTVSCKFVTENAQPAEEEEEVKDEIPILSNIKEGILNIASEIVPKDKASPIVGSVLALAIIVIGLLGYSLYKRRKGSDDEEEIEF